MALEDQWTKHARRWIAEYRVLLRTEPHWTVLAARYRDQIAWLEEEIVAHLERKAADPSNVIVLDYYRD
ncbi:hypothetical protein ACEQ6A_08805 [Rhizobium brockwellii]|uniref:hypothetical protein n=1 Tax=Rhizobium brockwellii TaxID=3019932 RepID=UPI003F99315E